MTKPWEEFQEQEAKPWAEYGGDPSLEAPMAAPEIPPEASPMEKADMFLRQNLPAWVPELASSMNRPILETIDFLGPDTFNAISSLLGSDVRSPTLMESVPGAKGEFMEEGAARDIVQATGETATIGGMTGQALKQLTTRGPQVAQKYLAPLAETKATADIAYGGVSGAGAEYGQKEGGDTGAMVGAILAPTAAATATQPVKGLINMGSRGIERLTTSLSQMSDDAASKLLAEAMVREGLSPDDVARELQRMGPDAIPADLGANFNSLLRAASNKIPRIAGRSSAQMAERQAGQPERLVQAFDDASGTAMLDVDDEIVRLNQAVGDDITSLYNTARDQGFRFSDKMRTILQGKNSLANAFNKAQRNLRDVRASGEKVSNIDLVDETKRVLDDRIGAAIRQGKNNEAMRLTRLKKELIAEADAANPTYKQARDLFAGKAELENAAVRGEDFFKLKARDVKEIYSSMSESEQRMFKLGAKRAIMDKVESLQDNSNAVRRLFGKTGDVKKLREIFDDDQAFQNFSDVLEREANFVVTKNAVTGNSTTTKQLMDLENTGKTVETVKSFIANPREQSMKLLGDIKGKKGDIVVEEALEKVGDILLESGMDSQRVVNILKRGSQKEIQKVLDDAIPKLKMYESEVMVPTGKAVIAETTEEITE